jgi:hypothetical protein
MRGGSQEHSFIDQTVRFHAAGGDIDALVRVWGDGGGGVRFEDETNGGTRLNNAAFRGYCSAIKTLLKLGADVHLGVPSNPHTPLHIASWEGHRDAAVLLLDAGARVDDRDGNGRTALHISARKNHSKFCKLLLSRGASLDARDADDRDPEFSALLRGCTNTAELLAAVRAAGGWPSYLEAPRKELLALRQRLPALRKRGRAAPSSSVRAHERLFLDVPDDVFGHVLAFWRSDRDD